MPADYLGAFQSRGTAEENSVECEKWPFFGLDFVPRQSVTDDRDSGEIMRLIRPCGMICGAWGGGSGALCLAFSGVPT